MQHLNITLDHGSDSKSTSAPATNSHHANGSTSNQTAQRPLQSADTSKSPSQNSHEPSQFSFEPSQQQTAKDTSSSHHAASEPTVSASGDGLSSSQHAGLVPAGKQLANEELRQVSVPCVSIAGWDESPVSVCSRLPCPISHCQTAAALMLSPSSTSCVCGILSSAFCVLDILSRAFCVQGILSSAFCVQDILSRAFCVQGILSRAFCVQGTLSRYLKPVWITSIFKHAKLVTCSCTMYVLVCQVHAVYARCCTAVRICQDSSGVIVCMSWTETF